MLNICRILLKKMFNKSKMHEEQKASHSPGDGSLRGCRSREPGCVSTELTDGMGAIRGRLTPALDNHLSRGDLRCGRNIEVPLKD